MILSSHFIISFLSLMLSTALGTYHEYCIIGAGPGGLQMGYFLQRSGRDYMIFEQNSIPGSFFVKYPRHRKLISINKGNTGRSNIEFNLRHDWNSLISDDQSLLFTRYSEDYFPHADQYLKYLKDYQEKLKIAVQFDTTISNITNDTQGALQQFRMRDQHGNKYECRYLIVANGISVPKRYEMAKSGNEHIEDYSTISVNPNDFENQTVLIIGWGNSGLETAINIYGKAAYIHMAGRDRPKFSWETHYVGDIRGVNNELVDSYMLKSLDGFLGPIIPGESFLKGSDGKIRLAVEHLQRSKLFDHFPARDGYDRVIACIGFKWDNTIFNNSSINLTKDVDLASYGVQEHIFNKYPTINYTYEAVTVPGLYVAGAAAHILDTRKSAGGFIHGYRYSVRALHRHLEWKNHGTPWPSVNKPLGYLLSTLQKRMNEASGIYQMFTTFLDVAIIDTKTATFRYLEEIPTMSLPHLKNLTGHKFIEGQNVIVTLALQYGKNFSEPGKDVFGGGRVTTDPKFAHRSNFLHPVVKLYHSLPKDTGLVIPEDWEGLFKPDGLHHVLEDFTTGFNCPSTHGAPLRMFLEHHLGLDLNTPTAKICSHLSLFSHHETGQLLTLGCRRILASQSYDL